MFNKMIQLVVPMGILLLLLNSCAQDDSSFPVGEDWVASDTRVLYIDTMTVNSSTFKFDSIQVSNTDRLLLGAYTDPIFGKTTSKIFTQLSNSTYTLDRDAVFDSIALILNYDDYFYNDTTQIQSLKIHEVLQDIKTTDDGYFYNTTSFEYDENAVGEVQFIPRPIREDSLHLRLDDDYGKLLFTEIQENEINNTDEFLRYHRGLLLNPGGDNTTILGFLPTSTLRIYYSLPDEVEVDESESFDMIFNSSYTYHNISSDRSGTYFENLAEQEDEVSSSTANAMSYVQGGVGLATRIDIPNLAGLDYIEGKGTLLSANLMISLNTATESTALPAQESLAAYIIDQKNVALGTLYDYSGSEASATIAAESDEFAQRTYSLPIHYFLDEKRTDSNGENWYLALIDPENTQAVNRYSFYNSQAADDDLKLQIILIYAVYNNE